MSVFLIVTITGRGVHPMYEHDRGDMLHVSGSRVPLSRTFCKDHAAFRMVHLKGPFSVDFACFKHVVLKNYVLSCFRVPWQVAQYVAQLGHA